MRGRRVTKALFGTVVLLAALCASAIAHAQTIESADQLLNIQNLTPEQRAALADALLKVSNTGVTPSPSTAPAPTLTLDEQLDSLRRLGIEAPPPATPLAAPEPLATVEPGSTIVVNLAPRIDLAQRLITDPATGDIQFDGKALGDRLARLVGRNVYQLDRYGVLSMQGVYSIPLAGLTVEAAAARIGAEPDLRIFDATVTLLPLTPTGSAALELFGRELFNNVPTSFAPATDIPIPLDYVIGPGDTITVQLYGNDNQQLELVVTRDGIIQFPGIGPVVVAGLDFDAMRAELERRVSEQMIGVRTSITLGALRSLRVFVMGDVERPGSYTVSGLSTISNALFSSGGIRDHGSLRRVELHRNGVEVGRLDLYELLLHGDTSAATSGDLRVESGDVILVPPIGHTVGVEGEVNRPAIYELKDETTVGQAIELAGGLLPSALTRMAHVERIGAGGVRTVVDVDVTSDAGRRMALVNGDVVRIRPALEESKGTVALSGHVFDAREYQWHEGMRLTDLIRSVDMLQPGADLHYVLVRRELPPDRRLELLSADLGTALAAPGTAVDLPLASRDRVMVFDLQSDRSNVVNPLLAELAQQARNGKPIPEVVISGRVNAPGHYPLEPGMRVTDLLRAGGMLHEAAYTVEAELTRYEVLNGESRDTELVKIDLQRALSGDPGANIPLEPHDYLNVKEIPQWSEQESVEVVGEVRFPGVYPIHRSETLSSVLLRAGGLTDLAFPEGTIFVREELKAREADQIELLSKRLESDLVSFSLQAAQTKVDTTQVLSLGESLLEQLRTAESTGRLVIDIQRVMASAGDSVYDITLKDGDRLLVPKRTQEVTIIGEVQYATSHIYEPGLQREDYIARSGGLTAQADRKLVYVVHANGSVVTSERSAWFRRSQTDEMRPGDTIVVPIDADRVAPMARWTGVSQIVYQLAVAVLAVNRI